MPVLHRLTKRDASDDATEVKLKAFEKDLKLYLYPTEGMLATTDTPVWTVSADSSAPEGMRFKQIPGVYFQ